MRSLLLALCLLLCVSSASVAAECANGACSGSGGAVVSGGYAYGGTQHYGQVYGSVQTPGRQSCIQPRVIRRGYCGPRVCRRGRCR